MFFYFIINFFLFSDHFNLIYNYVLFPINFQMMRSFKFYYTLNRLFIFYRSQLIQELLGLTKYFYYFHSIISIIYSQSMGFLLFFFRKIY